jgi:hypothetical protein
MHGQPIPCRRVLALLSILASLAVTLAVGSLELHSMAQDAVQIVVFRQGQDGYDGCADTRISREFPNANFGAGELVLGMRGDVGTLIRFDVSDIPSNATVQKATLSLQVANFGQRPDDSIIVAAYTVARHWEEMEATWIRATDTNLWGLPGCNDTETDRSATAVHTQEIRDVRWFDWDITSAVQVWVGQPTSNMGLLLQQSNPEVGGEYDVRESEYSDSTQRPYLTVKYFIATPTPTSTASTAPTQSATTTASATATETGAATETATATATATSTQTGVPSDTAVATMTATSTQTGIPEETKTATESATSTRTGIPAETATATTTAATTQTDVPTGTATATGTSTRVPTETQTRTITPTPTPVIHRLYLPYIWKKGPSRLYVPAIARNLFRQCQTWGLTFQDEFENAALPGWSISLAEGRQEVAASVIHLWTESAGKYFPVLWRNDVFSGAGANLAIEARFRHSSFTAYGTTIAINSASFDGNRIDAGQSLPPGIEDILSIHHVVDAAGGVFRFDISLLHGQVKWSGTPGDTTWHEVTVKLEDGNYTLLVDGQRIGSAQSGVLPGSVYIGNPTIQHFFGNWTQLYVDYIRVFRCQGWQ